MSETEKFQHPDIVGIYQNHTDNPYVTTLSAYAVDGKHYSLEDYEMEVIFTKKVKPLPDGMIVQFVAVKHNIYVRNGGAWWFFNSCEAPFSWKESMYNDEGITISLNAAHAIILYTPEKAK